jgi:hypothetical protein
MQAPRTRNRILALAWPCVIVLSAAVAIVSLQSPGGSPVRVAATLWFVLLCPGSAYVRLLDLGDLLIELGLAVALSICLATVLSLVMIYLKLWHPVAALYVLAVIAAPGVDLQLRSARPGARDAGTGGP